MTSVHHPLDPRIFYKECLSLKKAGFDVTLIAPYSEDIKVEESAVHIVPFKKNGNRFLSMLLSPLKVYQIAKQFNADVYHFHDPELLPVAWLLKKRKNVVIYDIHEDYETGIVQRNYLNKPLRKILSMLYKTVEKVFSRSMELCLAEKYYLEKYPEGQCILNYPILNEELLHLERKVMEDKLIYTGNVREDRGALIHSSFPDINKQVSVFFYGKCSNELASRMKKQASGNDDRIHITGVGRYVPKNEIDHAYKAHNWLAGIAVFPPSDHFKKKELTKFFEYMSAGIPVICSDFPVWRDFISKYNCGVAVNPNDKAEIKAAIDLLKGNPDKAKEMGENGREAVKKELNWGIEELKLVNWYDSLWEKRKHRG